MKLLWRIKRDKLLSNPQLKCIKCNRNLEIENYFDPFIFCIQCGKLKYRVCRENVCIHIWNKVNKEWTYKRMTEKEAFNMFCDNCGEHIHFKEYRYEAGELYQ